MTRVVIDGETYACPFAGLLRSHTPAERAAMRESILADGVTSPIITYISDTHGRAIVDGMNRPVYVAELVDEGHEVEPPPVLCLGHQTDKTAKRLALSLNVARRQLTVEEQQAARGERINRVLAAVGAGAGIRETARAEGVSAPQILRDIADSDGVTGVTAKPSRKVPLVVRAHRRALSLTKAVRVLADSATHRERLSAVASSHGCPMTGKDWPALELVLAVLRDVAGGGVSK